MREINCGIQGEVNVCLRQDSRYFLHASSRQIFVEEKEDVLCSHVTPYVLRVSRLNWAAK